MIQNYSEIDVTKKYLILRHAPRRLHGMYSYRTLWYLTPYELCRASTKLGCHLLNITIESKTNLDQTVYITAFTRNKANDVAKSLGYDLISYQSINHWLHMQNKYARFKELLKRNPVIL